MLVALVALVAARPECEASAPAMVVLGGSNTGGANAKEHHGLRTVWGRPHTSFARRFAATLRDVRLAWNVDGGGGPISAGACTDELVPRNTRYATVEYLPNIGYIRDDNAELNSIRRLLRELRARGALVFVVNIYSGSQRYADAEKICGRFRNATNVIGCMTRARVTAIGASIRQMARAVGAHVVEVDADASPALFGADSFHLNQAGHDHVFAQIAAINATRAPSACRDSDAANETRAASGVLCASQLDALVAGGTFARTDIAPPKKEPKIVWASPLARTPAWIDLNLTLPTTRSVYDGVYTTWNAGDAQFARAFARNRIKIGLGFLVSHNPTHGVARIRCLDCVCDCDGCAFDTRRNISATVTAFKVLHTNATGRCTLRIGVDAPAQTRVMLQKAIVGLNDFRTRWLRGLDAP